MSLPRYPAYQDTGVPTLGLLPRHWKGQALKRVANRIESGVSVNARDEPVSGFGVGVLKTSCVYSGRFDAAENKAVVDEELDRVACPVRAGTLIVSRMNTPALVGAAGLVSTSADNLYLPDRLWQVHFVDANPAFAHYWTASPSYRAQVEMACAGTSASMQNLSQEDFLRFVLPLPPLEEQAAIAQFLDRETAKIDSLIAEQEKLIALLAEKRQATISHAVTRGLDPDVPMQHSDLPFLGEVPAHWSVFPLRRVVLAIEQGWSPECYAREAEANEWGVLKAGCLNGGIFRPTENKALPPELTPDATYEVVVGDVLMSRASGSTDLVGSTAVVTATRPGLMLSDKIFRLRLQDLMTPRYFVSALNSRALRTQIENALSGGNGMANNLPQSNLLAFWIPVPPKVEQEQIADFVESEASKLDSLSAESGRAIALLKERRSALITAAVTGQIDVRHAVPA